MKYECELMEMTEKSNNHSKLRYNKRIKGSKIDRKWGEGNNYSKLRYNMKKIVLIARNLKVTITLS